MNEPLRNVARRGFLERCGLAGWMLAPLRADASRRRYFRLRNGTGASLILMDAPPETNPPLDGFIATARILAEAGLSVPRIHEADPEQGFMLLEDFGDALLADVITKFPGRAAMLYGETLRAIAQLQARADATALPVRTSGERARLALPAIDDYAAPLAPTSPGACERLVAALEEALCRLAPEAGVPVHRDCHGENLVWLPDRRGIARVGWLDFQDAEQGHPAYDPVSLLCDVRRDLPADLVARMKALFLAETGSDPAEFEAAWATLGAQRNLRILGIFARLARREGKPGYLAHMPRVWRQLMRHLDHPDLRDLRDAALATLPEPTPAILARLAEPCPTPPAP
jgi:hypothetical protein